MARITIAEITADEEEYSKLTAVNKTKFIEELSDAVDEVDSDTDVSDSSLELEVIER